MPRSGEQWEDENSKGSIGRTSCGGAILRNPSNSNSDDKTLIYKAKVEFVEDKDELCSLGTRKVFVETLRSQGEQGEKQVSQELGPFCRKR